MENSQQCINFFVTDCSEKNSEKIRKHLSIIADDCYVYVNNQYTSNGFGLYVFECETIVDLPYEVVEHICEFYSCRLVFANVTLKYDSEL